MKKLYSKSYNLTALNSTKEAILDTVESQCGHRVKFLYLMSRHRLSVEIDVCLRMEIQNVVAALHTHIECRCCP